MKLDERLSHVFRSVFDMPEGPINDDVSPATLPQWDSVGHLQLMLALEEEFGVQFSPDDMAALSSVAVIRAKLLALSIS